jgi:antirestriction protein ArdC
MAYYKKNYGKKSYNSEPKKTLTHAEMMELIAEKTKDQLPPWCLGVDATTIFPANAITRFPYNGINRLIGFYLSHFYGSNLFATQKMWFDYAMKLNYFGKFSHKQLLKRDENNKPEQGNIFFYVNWIKRELKEGEDCPDDFKVNEDGKDFRKVKIYREFVVFNLNQLHPDLVGLIKENEANREVSKMDDNFMLFANGLDANIKYVPTMKPCYIPSLDQIQTPPVESFEKSEDFAATLAHEIGHWTGHSSRMDREGIKRVNFGADIYATEEGIAEVFAMLTLNRFGIHTDHSQVRSASYIQHWTKRFADHPTLLFEIFRDAERAFNWSMKHSGLESKQEDETDNEVELTA